MNEGRSFETLIPAMAQVDCILLIYGDGNFTQQARKLVKDNNLETKILFRGKKPPSELRDVTNHAWIGLTLFENNGLSNYLSLANRFADYIHAGIPQICVDYPAYRNLNDQYDVAVLLPNIEPAMIAQELNKLLTDEFLYGKLQSNCLKAREALNWQMEEIMLKDFYKNIFEEHG